MYIAIHCHMYCYIEFGTNFDTQFGVPNINLYKDTKMTPVSREKRSKSILNFCFP